MLFAVKTCVLFNETKMLRRTPASLETGFDDARGAANLVETATDGFTRDPDNIETEEASGFDRGIKFEGRETISDRKIAVDDEMGLAKTSSTTDMMALQK